MERLIIGNDAAKHVQAYIDYVKYVNILPLEFNILVKYSIVGNAD